MPAKSTWTSALECCQLFSLAGTRAETFETYGNLYRERGEIERAIEYYERAARAYDEAGIGLTSDRITGRTGFAGLADRRPIFRAGAD